MLVFFPAIKSNRRAIYQKQRHFKILQKSYAFFQLSHQYVFSAKKKKHMIIFRFLTFFEFFVLFLWLTFKTKIIYILIFIHSQAVGCALSMLGLGESIAGLLEIEKNPWAQRVFASLAVMVLSVIDLAGIKWVVKLQFVLLLVLLFAGLDFAVGSFVHTDVRKFFLS